MAKEYSEDAIEFHINKITSEILSDAIEKGYTVRENALNHLRSIAYDPSAEKDYTIRIIGELYSRTKNNPRIEIKLTDSNAIEVRYNIAGT